MILGLDRHPAAHCFAELDLALTQMGLGDIILNGHAFPGECMYGRTILNLENVGIQVQADAFQGCRILDFSERNIERWRAAGREARYFPIGYHPSMEVFDCLPWEQRDIDVVFSGCMNERRERIINELRNWGLRVVVIGSGQAYGAERDAILARSKLAMNFLFHEAGTFPVLRAAHCAANGLTCLSEIAPEMPEWTGPKSTYDGLVKGCIELVRDREFNERMARETYEAFKRHPMKRPADPEPWAMLRDVPAEAWDLEAMYASARHGPVNPTPLVAIAMPRYRESGRITRIVGKSLEHIEDDLEAHGIQTGRIDIEGDSLVTRMRQRVCQMFMRSVATHLLFCDADIEVLDPTCVRKMLASGYDIVAGACPFKQPDGKVVCNLWPQTEAAMVDGANLEFPRGCIEVMDAGTGFMLISRRALVRMMQAHPELLHWSQSNQDRGEPLFALFDTGIVDGVYQSEDFRFCRYWQALGEKVYVYVPATFKHWGETGFEGSFAKHYGLEPTVARP